ncbi:hypothetical protein GCM10009000_115970 [Halobacterium noricense]
MREWRAGYEQSLSALYQVNRESDIYTKTSLMLGVGEYAHEIYQTLSDLREVGVDIVTLGQYLQPSRSHLDVTEYVHPQRLRYLAARRRRGTELPLLCRRPDGSVLLPCR